MHNRVAIMRVALLNHRSLNDIAALLEDVEFDQAAVLGFGIGVGVELFFVEAVDVADASEPGVQETHVGVGEGGLDATADVVAADDNVLHVEVGDGCGGLLVSISLTNLTNIQNSKNGPRMSHERNLLPSRTTRPKNWVEGELKDEEKGLTHHIQ